MDGRACSRRSNPSTRASYERYLHKFLGQLERKSPDVHVREVTTDDCRHFLDGWIERSPSTVCSIHSALSGLFKWLYLEGEIDANPMVRIPRPRRPRPDDLDVVIVTPADVERMLGAARDWQEFLCMSVLAYLGPRRVSASRLRWRDVDLEEGTLRFREKGNKGNKVSVKPMPHELHEILRAAHGSGQLRCEADDYVIPNRLPRTTGKLSTSIGLTEFRSVRFATSRSGRPPLPARKPYG